MTPPLRTRLPVRPELQREAAAERRVPLLDAAASRPPLALTPAVDLDDMTMAVRLGHPVLTERDFNRLSQIAQQHLGLKMAPGKRVMFQSRLLRRLRTLGLESFTEYCNHLESPAHHATELVQFLDLVTTNKTSFLREPVHFEALVDEVLPALLSRERYRPRPLAFWSAGCSTGMEPYTLAMLLAHHQRTHPEQSWDYSIFATDISTRVLQSAREAIYTEEDVAPLPLELRKAYLLRSRDRELNQVRIRPELRAKVSFERVNLMDEPSPVKGEFDVVFCRNVLIYFSREDQAALVGRLCERLRPGGFLFVGLTETLQDLGLPVRLVGRSTYVRT